MRARSLLCVSVLAGSLRAQAPVITPKGDPSVANDTIYRLAKDAEKSTHGFVILLDDGVVRVDRGGRSTRTWRTVVYIRDLASALDWRTGGVEYDPTYESARLNWARVVQPDGKVISAEPARMKDDLRPNDDDRGYYHEAALRWRLEGVEPGTIVDYSVTVQADSMPRGLELPGVWRIGTSGVRVERSRYLLDVSDSLRIWFAEQDLGFPHRETAKDGRRTYLWTTSNVEVAPGEAFVPDSFTDYPYIRFRTDTSWIAIGEWYRQRGIPRIALGKLGEQRFHEITGPARTRADTIAAIYKFAVQGVVTLDADPRATGWWPWAPDRTIENYRGSPEDKSVLLVAMLRRAGVDAAYALVIAKSRHDEAEPTPGAIAGAVVRVVQGADTMWIDAASQWLAPGVLPDHIAGALAVVIPAEGRVSLARLPRPAAGVVSASRNVIVGSMDATGGVSWRHTVTLTGRAQEFARRTFRVVGDSSSNVFAGILKQLAGIDLPNGEGSDFQGFKPRDLLAPVEYSYTVRAPALQAQPTRALLPLSFADFTGYVAAAEYLEHHRPRRSPIDLARMMGDSSVTWDLRLTLPPGWTATLPPDVNSTGEFGTVIRTYAQDGRDLHLTQTVTGVRGAIPAARAGELVAWLRAVSAYRAPYIVIVHAKQ